MRVRLHVGPSLGALCWVTAGSVWFVNGLQGLSAAKGSDRFYLTEAVWLPVHTLVAVGLVALLTAYGRSGRAVRVGASVALAGRVIFLAGEVVALVTTDDETFLLPLAAVTTAVGMIVAGVGLARSPAWRGWRRYAVLAMGVYPFVAMFPVFAVTGERPNVMVSGWGLTFVAVGLALLASEPRSLAEPAYS